MADTTETDVYGQSQEGRPSYHPEPNVKSIISEITEQAYRKCIISIAMKLNVDENDIKVTSRTHHNSFCI